jgi:hypothetical protein
MCVAISASLVASTLTELNRPTRFRWALDGSILTRTVFMAVVKMDWFYTGVP